MNQADFREKRPGQQAPGTVIFLRHGHTRLNSGRETSVDRIRGWVDVPLSAEGRQDAANLARFVDQTGIVAVVSSDLTRARETGLAVARRVGAKFTATRAMRPWNLGDFQGQPSKDTAPQLKAYVTEHPDEAVPGGESFNEFKHRGIAAIRKVLQGAKRQGVVAAVATHYRLLKLLEAWLAAGARGEAIEPEVFFRDDISPAAVVAVSPQGEGWRGRVLSEGLEK